MSEVSDKVTVNLLIADYAGADQSGKLNVIGGGIQVVGFDPQTGVTAPFAVVAELQFPSQVFNEDYSFELILEDAGDEAVTLPGIVPGGEHQTMRIGHNAKVEEPSFPGRNVPRRSLPSRANWVINLNTGIPLPPGQVYHWRVKIDLDTRDDWSLPFFVDGPQPPPVIG